MISILVHYSFNFYIRRNLKKTENQSAAKNRCPNKKKCTRLELNWIRGGRGGSVDRQTPHTKGIPPVEKDVLVYSCPFPQSSSLPNTILKNISNHSHRIQLNCHFHLTTQNQIQGVLRVQYGLILQMWSYTQVLQGGFLFQGDFKLSRWYFGIC